MKKIFTLFSLLFLSLSAFSTLVTFELSMKGSGIAYDSVFIVGIHTDWNFVEMADQGDSLYSVTMNLDAGDSTAFYFITIGWWASDYADYRELVPEECDYSLEYAGWDGDRGLEVPDDNTTFSYIWGSCETPGNPTSVSDNQEIDLGLNVFPNPASEFLTLSWGNTIESGSVEIIDLSGKTMKSFNIYDSLSEINLDISDIAKGIYIIKVFNKNELGYKKIVIN